MQRAESYGLRGHRDEGRAERRYAHRKAMAEDVARLHETIADGRLAEIYRPSRRATPQPSRKQSRPVRRELASTAGRAGERRVTAAEAAGKLPEGRYRLPDGTTLTVGERLCAEDLRELRRRRLEALDAPTVERAVRPKRKGATP